MVLCGRGGALASDLASDRRGLLETRVTAAAAIGPGGQRQDVETGLLTLNTRFTFPDPSDPPAIACVTHKLKNSRTAYAL